MTVMAWLLFDQQAYDDTLALKSNTEGVANILPDTIDNPLANNLGEGDIDNDHYVAPARLLNDPECSRYYDICGALPIHTWDSDVLFMPDPEL